MSAGSANLLELIVRGVSEGVAEALNSAAKGAEDMAKRVAAASAKADGALQKAATDMGKVGDSLASDFKATASSIVSGLETIAVVAAGAVVAGLTLAGKAAKDFDAALTEISTLNVSTEALEGYHDALLNIAKTTSVGLVDLTKGLHEAIRSGAKDAAVATELLNTAQMASVAVGGDVVANVDVLSRLLNTFGSEARTSAEKVEFLRGAGDKLNAIMDSGTFTFEELSKSLGKIGPLASVSGVSLDEVGGALAVLSKEGVPARETLSGLESLLEKMIAPSAKTTELAKALGVELGEAALKTNGFEATIQALTTATGGSAEALTRLLGDATSAKLALTIGAEGAKAFGDEIAGIGESAGSLSSDFEKMEETVDNRIKRLGNTLLADLIPVFEELKGTAANALEALSRAWAENGDEFVAGLRGVLDTVGRLVSFLVENRDTVVAVFAAMFAKRGLDLFLGGLSAIQSAVGGVGAAIKTLGSASSASFTAIAGSVGTIGGALLALIPVAVFVGTKMVEAIGSFRDFAKKALEDVARGAREAHEAVLGRTESTLEMVRDFAEEDAEVARFTADKAIAENKRALEAIEGARIAADDRVARLTAERAAMAEGALRDAVDRELRLAEAKKKSIDAEVFDRTRAIEIIEAETDRAIRAGAERAVADAEGKKALTGASAADAIAKIKAVEDFDKASYERRLKEADKFFGSLKGAVAAGAKLLEESAASAVAVAAEDEKAARALRIGTYKAIKAGAQGGLEDGFEEGLQESGSRPIQEDIASVAQGGMQEGLEEAAEAPGWGQKFGRALVGVLTRVAKFFGDVLMDAAQTVGNFFLDLFVTGPLSEFMNLLRMASDLPAQAQLDEGGNVQQAGFADALAETFQGWIDKITNFVQNLPTLLQGLVPFVGNLVNAFVDAVPRVVDAFVANIGPLIQSVIQSIGTLADTFRDNIEGFIGDVEAAIEAWLPKLVDALIDLVLSSLNADVFQRVQQMIADLVGQLIGGIIELLPDLIGFILETAPDLIIALVDVIVGDLIPKLIGKIPDIIGAFLEGLPDMIGELVEGLVGGILSALPGIVTSLIQAIVDMLGQGGGLQLAGEIVYAVIVALINAAIEFGNAIAEAFKNAFAGDTFKVAAEDVGKLIGRAILGALTGGVSEVVRGAVNRGREGRRQREAAAAYDAAVVAWQNEAAGQDAAWLAANPPPEASDYQAHTGGLILPSGQVQHFRFGGVVQAMQAAFARAGSGGETPIMATPGEMVLTPDQQAQLFAAAQGGGARGGNVYNLMPGSAVIVDGQKNIDAVLSNALERGTGKAGRAMRAKAGPPIRPIPRFGVG